MCMHCLVKIRKGDFKLVDTADQYNYRITKYNTAIVSDNLTFTSDIATYMGQMVTAMDKILEVKYIVNHVLVLRPKRATRMRICCIPCWACSNLTQRVSLLVISREHFAIKRFWINFLGGYFTTAGNSPCAWDDDNAPSSKESESMLNLFFF
ncbi:uncharacterized protein [Rutidosis leptorrhynchoides]|uniref:uncharacterized protein n=1 Tax=Rutidosis leptorrhynchoides TaxID=125765 RepID=UPI003A9A2B5D